MLSQLVCLYKFTNYNNMLRAYLSCTSDLDSTRY